MKPPSKNVYWAAIGVVSRIGDELIVEADFCRGGKCVAVIGLDDLLQPGMWQRACADERRQGSGVIIGGVCAGNAIDDACDANRVVRPVPQLAVERGPYLDRAVDVGVIPRLDIAVGPAGTSEQAHGVGHLL